MRPRTVLNLSKVVTLILIVATLSFTGLTWITITKQQTPTTRVPYAGMTLTYFYNKTTDIEGSTAKDQGNIVIDYVAKTPNGLFQVEAHDELFTTLVLVNATTRQYVSGAASGSYVGHLVPLNLSVGDMVMIYPMRNFTVESTDSYFELRPGLTVKVFVLTYNYSSVNADATYYQTIFRYFDTSYGILIHESDKDVTYNKAYGTIERHDYETRLVDGGQDGDKDGLSDFKELFTTRTDPLNPDTDGDLWPDALDPWPSNVLLPNGLVLGLLMAAGFSSFYIYWQLKKNKS